MVSASTKSAAAEPGITVNTNKKITAITNSNNYNNKSVEHNCLRLFKRTKESTRILFIFKEENLPQNLRFYTNTQACFHRQNHEKNKEKTKAVKRLMRLASQLLREFLWRQEQPRCLVNEDLILRSYRRILFTL